VISIGYYLLLLILVSLVAYIVYRSEKLDTRDPRVSQGDKKGVEMIRVCPRCGSTDVVLDTDTHKAAAEFGGKLYYRCRTCGFIAPTFPEMTKE
jgi:predicted RNA-binding Zn-ribbon protein involved in translation (DUF1610 family)